MKSAKTCNLTVSGETVELVENQDIPKKYEKMIQEMKPDWIKGSKANKEGFRQKTEDEVEADAADAKKEADTGK